MKLAKAVPSEQDTPPHEVFLRPGEWFASAQAKLFRTVLGSCVTVCLYDPGTRVGGMNHFMLPGESPDRSETSGRYGIPAMDLLIAELARLGADKARLVAKVFGGSKVLVMSANAPSVADSNIEFARSYLSRAGIPVTGFRTGGDTALEVMFWSHSGRSFAREVQPVKPGFWQRWRLLVEGTGASE